MSGMLPVFTCKGLQLTSADCASPIIQLWMSIVRHQCHPCTRQHLYKPALHWAFAFCVQAEMLAGLLSDKRRAKGAASSALSKKDLQGLGVQAQKKAAGIVDFAYGMVAGCTC